MSSIVEQIVSQAEAYLTERARPYRGYPCERRKDELTTLATALERAEWRGVVTITGPTCSGKTTLINALAAAIGAIIPQVDVLRVDAADFFDPAELLNRAKSAVVLIADLGTPSIPVAVNVTLPALAFKYDRGQCKAE